MENSKQAEENAAATVYIELNRIVIPEDARCHDVQEIGELARSMVKSGQLQEIVVVPLSGDGEKTKYEVRAGVGRVKAADILCWRKIRCNIRPAASDYEKRLITFVENEKREDASPLYQAQLLSSMMKAKGCTQRDLAAEVDKDEATVSEYLSLLSFSPAVQKNFAAAKFSIKQLLELKKLPTDEAQLAAAKECENLTNEESKKVIHKHLAAHGKAPKAKKAESDVAWKGDKIVINRPFSPKEETKDIYLAWLNQAIDGALAARPADGRGSPPEGRPSETPQDAAVVQAITEPVRQAGAASASAVPVPVPLEQKPGAAVIAA
jgi:ParB/RepB/Spo0J family partition protein